MSEKHQKCAKDHEEQPKNLVCVNPECIGKVFICNYCTFESHQGHKLLPVQIFMDKINKEEEDQKKEKQNKIKKEEAFDNDIAQQIEMQKGEKKEESGEMEDLLNLVRGIEGKSGSLIKMSYLKVLIQEWNDEENFKEVEAWKIPIASPKQMAAKHNDYKMYGNDKIFDGKKFIRFPQYSKPPMSLPKTFYIDQDTMIGMKPPAMGMHPFPPPMGMYQFQPPVMNMNPPVNPNFVVPPPMNYPRKTELRKEVVKAQEKKEKAKEKEKGKEKEKEKQEFSKKGKQKQQKNEKITINQIQPGDENLFFHAKIISIAQKPIKSRKKVYKQLVLGDQTGTVNAYFEENKLFEVGHTLYIKNAEASVYKKHIQVQNGSFQPSGKTIKQINHKNNISAKAWVESK